MKWGRNEVRWERMGGNDWELQEVIDEKCKKMKAVVEMSSGWSGWSG